MYVYACHYATVDCTCITKTAVIQTTLKSGRAFCVTEHCGVKVCSTVCFVPGLCQYKILACKAANWTEVIQCFPHYLKERAGIPL
jgi:hypothetical protein